MRGLARAIEHVGSTAVPELQAKPTIDILVGVGDIDDVGGNAETRLSRIGFEPRGGLGVPGRRYFLKVQRYPREFNVHVVRLGGSLWHSTLAFRDHLREHPEEARAYGALKLGLTAKPGGSEPDGYADGKASFTAGILSRTGVGG